MTERKPTIKSTDMAEDMQQDAVNTAVQVRGDQAGQSGDGCGMGHGGQLLQPML